MPAHVQLIFCARIVPIIFFNCFLLFFCHLKVVSSILGSQVCEREFHRRYPSKALWEHLLPKLTMRMLTVDVSSPGTDLGNELLLPLFVFGS